MDADNTTDSGKPQRILELLKELAVLVVTQNFYYSWCLVCLAANGLVIDAEVEGELVESVVERYLVKYYDEDEQFEMGLHEEGKLEEVE